MDQIWHRPNLVGPNMAPTKFGWTKNGSDQIWVWTKYGLDQIWARPNMLDQIWSDQKWPTKSVSTKSGLTPEDIQYHLYQGFYLKPHVVCRLDLKFSWTMISISHIVPNILRGHEHTGRLMFNI